MANYSIDKLENAAKILAGVCGSVLGGGLLMLLHSNKDDDEKDSNDKVEKPKGKKR